MANIKQYEKCGHDHFGREYYSDGGGGVLLGSLSTSASANHCICQAMCQKYFPNCFGV